MADFQARCPTCLQVFTYDGSLIGTTGTCPACGTDFIYPQPAFAGSEEDQPTSTGGHGRPEEDDTKCRPKGPSRRRGSTGPVPPRDPDVLTCPSCGAAAPVRSSDRCPFCGFSFAGADVGPTVPWEQRDRLGFFPALFATIKEVLFSPGDFYSRMPVTRNMSSPLLFAVIMGTAAGWIGIAFQLLLRGFRFVAAPPEETAVVMVILWVLALFMPLLIVVGAFIGSGILHLCLMIVGGANRGFEATFRVVCYANAAQVWTIIPVCGGLVAGVWTIVCETIGFSRAHNTSVGKAVLAVLLPLIAVFVCAAVVGVIGVGLAVTAGAK